MLVQMLALPRHTFCLYAINVIKIKPAVADNWMSPTYTMEQVGGWVVCGWVDIWKIMPL